MNLSPEKITGTNMYDNLSRLSMRPISVICEGRKINLMSMDMLATEISAKGVKFQILGVDSHHMNQKDADLGSLLTPYLSCSFVLAC